MTYKIVSKYVKDLSFEIPDAKTFFLLEKNIKDYKIKIDINSKSLKEKIMEVNTRLSFEGKEGEKNNARVEVLYSSIVTMEPKIEREEIEKILIVKVPTENYPEIPVEYYFTDTGYELSETYDYLDKLKTLKKLRKGNIYDDKTLTLI